MSKFPEPPPNLANSKPLSTSEIVPQKTSATLVKVANDEPIKITIQNDISLGAVIAIIPIVTAVIGGLASFGDDNGGKRLTVLGAFSISAFLVGIVNSDNIKVLFGCGVAAIVFLAVGYCSANKYKPSKKGHER